MRTVKEIRQASDAGLTHESECMNTIAPWKDFFRPISSHRL
jgi:hypothetical protein